MKNLTVRFVKRGDELKYEQGVDKIKFKMFKDSLKEGEVIEILANRTSGDGSLAQLSKLHASIREIAKFVGSTVQDEKLRLKKKAGFCIHKTIDGEHYLYCKSFGDCTRDELDYVINIVEVELADLGIVGH